MSHFSSQVQERSYAEALAPEVRKTAKPIFIKEYDLFGTHKPAQSEWLNHIELYKAIADVLPPENIAGLQRVRGLWRIYMFDDHSRSILLTSSFSLRGKHMTVYDTNPGTPYGGDTMRIRVKNVPLSADDGQIKRTLLVLKCVVKSLFREKLRVDGRLTNCETGDRIAIVEKLQSHLPKSIEIGRYSAIISYPGQPNERNKQCNNCLRLGHSARECTNEMVCFECHETGHRMSECPEKLEQDDVTGFSQSESDEESTCTGEDSDNDSQVPKQSGSDSPPKPATQANSVASTTSSCDTSSSAPSISTNTDETVHTTNDAKDSTRKKKRPKKPKKAMTSTTGTLDKFFDVNTPSSSAKSGMVRSPTTPTEQVEARDRASKKHKEDAT